MRARVRRVPEGVGLLHDAARLAVKRGAVAAVAHRLVVHALPSGKPPALGGCLLGLRLGLGLGVSLGVVFRVCLSGHRRGLCCTVSPRGRLGGLLP